MNLIDYIAKLSDKTRRQDAAKELAQYLHAQNLIIFIRDPAMDLLLPGSGFYAVLKQSKIWKEFINRNHSFIYEGQFPDPETGELKHAIAIPTAKGSVAVLIGGDPSPQEVNDLQRILPIVVALLEEEQKIESFSGIAKTAAKASEKSDRLAQALDTARKELLVTLDENTSLLKKLKDRNRELEKINEELDSFVYTASHDLKAPVSNIEGLIAILKESLNAGLSHDSIAVINLITTSIEKFKTTILALTDITKLRKDIEEETADEVNLQNLIEELKILLLTNIAESAATIKTDIEVNEINYSRKNIWSILYNLLTNAIKYRSPDRDPVITITTRKTAEGFFLEVSDNGLGIKKESLVKLFSMFRRFHHHVEGSGIGLYLVKRVVESSGGRVEVESKEGYGSVFRIYLKDNHSKSHKPLTSVENINKV